MTPEEIAAALDHVEERLTANASRLRELTDHIERLRTEADAINIRLTALEAKRGRKAKPLTVREAGVCGLDPERNSAICPSASIYRYQQGCLGTACVEKNRAYYADRRAKKRADQA